MKRLYLTVEGQTEAGFVGLKSPPAHDGTRDRKRTVADGECDAFGRAAPDVSGGEDARAGGFDRAGLAVGQGPAVRFRSIGTGEDEALGIDGDTRRQPVGPRLGADEDKDGRAIELARTPARHVAEPQVRARPVAVAVDGVDLDVPNDLDLFMTLDPASKVGGHALADIATAKQEGSPLGIVGEEHDRLAGRVAAPHHGRAAALAGACVNRRARIVDANAIPSFAPGTGRR